MIRIRSGDTVTELAWTGENIPAARLLAQAGLYPDYPCGGQGRCGNCRVLAHGDLSPAAPPSGCPFPSTSGNYFLFYCPYSPARPDGHTP